MGALVTLNPPPAPVVPAFTMGDMERVASAIAKGGLFGTNDPNAVLTLCLVAQAEGKHPAQVMQDYDIIKGKPAKKAQAMLRDFLQAGGKVEWHQLDDDCADATFSHPQGGSARISWDNERVKNAGLTSDTHRKFARAMKRSRTVSEGVRTVFPGATGGFYVPEEAIEFAEPAKPREMKRVEPKPEPAVQPSEARLNAQKWASEQIDAVGATDTVEELDSLAAKAAKALPKLEREHPDLYEQVDGAFRARSAALVPAGDEFGGEEG